MSDKGLEFVHAEPWRIPVVTKRLGTPQRAYLSGIRTLSNHQRPSSPKRRQDAPKLANPPRASQNGNGAEHGRNGDHQAAVSQNGSQAVAEQLPAGGQSVARYVDEHGEVHDACPRCVALADELVGLRQTLDMQARKIGRLEREAADDDHESHPQRKEIADLIERWKQVTGHPRAKLSKDRFDVVKARLKDGYTLEQLRLAIDGIGAYPFVVNGSRRREGAPSQRHDKLSIALGGGEAVERFANLGARA